MTFEEKEAENIMAEEKSAIDVKDGRSELSHNKDAINISKEVNVRCKMEAMQKRINELKDKVRYEGELLYSQENNISQDIIDNKSLDSLSGMKSKDSLSQDSNFEDKIRETEEHSDKSLYYSASSYSMCSVTSNSSDSTYSSFTKFVNNFMKNQDHKERLNLLQLHSKQQISMNMMKTSLLELESRCSEELELVEKSLKHLNKLAVELNVDKKQLEEDTTNHKLKALDFKSSGDAGSWRPISKASLSWLPVREGSKTKFEKGVGLENFQQKVKDD